MAWWRSFTLLAVALAVGGTLFACAPATAVPTSGGAVTGAGSEFDAQWKQLIERAKQEGEVVIIMGPAGYRYSGPLREHFTKTFGIRVVATGGTGDQQVTRVLAERAAGRNTVDIAHLGVSSNVALANAGVLVPVWPQVIHPDILNPEGWIIPQPVYEDAQKQFILDRQAAVPANFTDVYYNTRKVSQAEIDGVQSWMDFLKPQWRGRIVTSMNPDTASGPPTYGWMFLGKTFFEPFIRQMNATHLPGASGREVMDGLAQGKWDVVLFYGGGDIRGELGGLQELGLPVARLERTLKEGTVIDLQGGMGIFDQAPHPNAAQLWFNWLMSKEGQTAENSVTEEVGPRPSLRKDIPRGQVRESDYNLMQQLRPDQVHIASTSDEAYNTAKAEATEFLKGIYTELRMYGY